MKKIKVLTIVGTRPEIIKLSQVIKKLDKYIQLLLVFFVYFPIFYLFGFYKAISRYNGLTTFLRVAKAIIIYGIFYFSIICVIGLNNVPRTVGLIQPLILFIFVSSWRLIAQFLLRSINNKKVEGRNQPNVLL